MPASFAFQKNQKGHTMADEKNRDTLDEAILDYVLDITDDPKAIGHITEMMDKMPDIDVRGALEKWQAVYCLSCHRD